jgi:hypothetical protein
VPRPVFRPAPRRSRRARALILGTLGASAIAVAGCRAVPQAFGPSPRAARTNAASVFSAFAARFTDVHRSPKFHAARGKLGKYALVPSKIFGDTSVWTSAPSPDSRQLVLTGSLDAKGYRFAEHPNAALPQRTGDSRHTMRLRRLGESEFEWTTGVDHAIGQMRAADIENVFGALLASAEGRGEQALRADYRTAFPRASAALGRLVSLDSLRTTPRPDGSTTIDMVATLHPGRVKAAFPALAEYLDKYVGPARYRFTLRDASGARWFDMGAANKRLVFRMRSKNGHLAPLDGGPARPMPDSLQLVGEMYAKFGWFTVGVSDLRGDFTVVRSPTERAWSLRFRREPEWHLPLASKHLIRSPLRRPFERGGTTVRVGVRDGGPETLLTRTARGAVKESAILRFFNSLSSTAMGDFAGKAEEEENRFTAQLFAALRDDVLALPLGGTESAPAATLGAAP